MRVTLKALSQEAERQRRRRFNQTYLQINIGVMGALDKRSFTLPAPNTQIATEPQISF